jgi:predicted RNase H-like HicB family nuclease
MTMQIKVVFNLKGAFRDDEVASGVVSFCPALNIFSHGKTMDEAKEALIKAISLFLETCYQRGTLGEILRKAGFNAEPLQFGTPVVQVKDDEYIAIHDNRFRDPFCFEVPLNLVAQAAKPAEFQHV